VRALPVVLLLAVILLGCGSPGEQSSTAAAPPPASPPAATTAPDPDREEAADLPLVVFLGDSLTAGLGLSEDQAFPAVLERRLAQEESPARIVNAGVSGDTSAGGLRRLSWLMRQQPDVLVVGLGVNDGLRGQPVAATEENLRQIVREAQALGARVLLLGQQIPPSYGPDYAAAFEDLYARIAAEEGVVLVPFLLEGVGGRPELNLPDGVHPTAEGHAILAETVLPYLLPLLGS